MGQLNLFVIEGEKSQEEVGFLIPKEVLSPLESKERPYSKKFKKQQKEFSDYVHLIQSIYNCSWFEARKIFFEHRDEQKRLKKE